MLVETSCTNPTGITIPGSTQNRSAILSWPSVEKGKSAAHLSRNSNLTEPRAIKGEEAK